MLTVNLAGLDAPGKALARAALDAWESVVNLRFREVTTGGEITFTDNNGSNDAYTQFPGPMPRAISPGPR